MKTCRNVLLKCGAKSVKVNTTMSEIIAKVMRLGSMSLVKNYPHWEGSKTLRIEAIWFSWGSDNILDCSERNVVIISLSKH